MTNKAAIFIIICMKQYRLLELISTLYITFLLISDVTAAKIVSIFGIPLSVTVLYFPITYILSDILTEVYGYAEARRVVWRALTASVIAGIVYQLVIFVPATFGKDVDDAYRMVLGAVPRVLIGGWIAFWVGAMLNDYVLAKLKVLTNGHHLWLRTIASTVAGELVNTTLFYVIALSGIIPIAGLMQAIIAATTIKIVVEVIFTPWTYFVVSKLKRLEGIDYFDHKTNFNPFILDHKS